MSAAPGGTDSDIPTLDVLTADTTVDDLIDEAAELYKRRFPANALTIFTNSGVTFLFDAIPGIDRTVLAVGQPLPPTKPRDTTYQRGYPLPELVGGRPVDRGHFIPFSGGGGFGPNLFVQDRALNRGWSRQGRKYRSLGRLATAQTPGSLIFAHPIHTDGTAMPEHIQLGVHIARGWETATFRNRYINTDQVTIDITLDAATDWQLGALGEETARAFLETERDAQPVTLGDGRLTRTEGRQDLDITAIIDGEPDTRPGSQERSPAPATSGGRGWDTPSRASGKEVRATRRTGSLQSLTPEPGTPVSPSR
ncbi:hypothetical protein [uncultured Leifsonia sp.]|uniref:hypothetical protein n=1 Tax=uncultured Leifsonia sp. TaxID=340359 RepID=UPI0028D30037|nr:hypothetical protein [uncultured Leifsonia sp.]